MSSQKGNASRTRAQRHQNKTAYKNTKYDTSQRNMDLIHTSQEGLCARCKDVIAWKIKYKKYKPLSQPATCVRCHQKTVKKAYYTVCQPCSLTLNVCSKCAQKKEIVEEYGKNPKEIAAEQRELERGLSNLSERERRKLFRLQAEGRLLEGLDSTAADTSDDDDDDDDNDKVDDGGDMNPVCDRERRKEDRTSRECHPPLVNSDDDDDEKVDAHTLFD